ncbi:MAG: hypothetical protein KKF62_07440, partial [Bacteroidetes bacterium]|nr:hypothetical protein [Bacteroidota bacterium]MBU1799313.1 hypothetical protein [Bacteroidota bacterium]
IIINKLFLITKSGLYHIIRINNFNNMVINLEANLPRLTILSFVPKRLLSVAEYELMLFL